MSVQAEMQFRLTVKNLNGLSVSELLRRRLVLFGVFRRHFPQSYVESDKL